MSSAVSLGRNEQNERTFVMGVPVSIVKTHAAPSGSPPFIERYSLGPEDSLLGFADTFLPRLPFRRQQDPRLIFLDDADDADRTRVLVFDTHAFVECLIDGYVVITGPPMIEFGSPTWELEYVPNSPTSTARSADVFGIQRSRVTDRFPRLCPSPDSVDDLEARIAAWGSDSD